LAQSYLGRVAPQFILEVLNNLHWNISAITQ
jgi:hypothetical protein